MVFAAQRSFAIAGWRRDSVKRHQQCLLLVLLDQRTFVLPQAQRLGHELADDLGPSAVYLLGQVIDLPKASTAASLTERGRRSRGVAGRCAS